MRTALVASCDPSVVISVFTRLVSDGAAKSRTNLPGDTIPVFSMLNYRERPPTPEYAALRRADATPVSMNDFNAHEVIVHLVDTDCLLKVDCLFSLNLLFRIRATWRHTHPKTSTFQWFGAKERLQKSGKEG